MLSNVTIKDYKNIKREVKDKSSWQEIVINLAFGRRLKKQHKRSFQLHKLRCFYISNADSKIISKKIQNHCFKLTSLTQEFQHLRHWTRHNSLHVVNVDMFGHRILIQIINRMWSRK